MKGLKNLTKFQINDRVVFIQDAKYVKYGDRGRVIDKRILASGKICVRWDIPRHIGLPTRIIELGDVYVHPDKLMLEKVFDRLEKLNEL
jgi:hypothetical protein